MRSVSGFGVGIGLGRFSRADEGPGLGLEVSLGFALLRHPSLPPSYASVPHPPPKTFRFSAPQSSWVANTFGPPPLSPRVTSQQPSGILSGLGCPLTLLPAQTTAVFPPVAPGAESAQHAAAKGEGLGLGLGIEVRLGQGEATARLSLGLGLEARGRKGIRLRPRPRLGRFSLQGSGGFPPPFLSTPPPPRGGLVHWEILTRQFDDVAFGDESLAAVHHLGSTRLLSSALRGGCVPPLGAKIKTSLLATLASSPPSRPLSSPTFCSPLLPYFFSPPAPKERRLTKPTGDFVVLVSPPLSPLPASPPPIPSPPPPTGGLRFRRHISAGLPSLPARPSPPPIL